MEDEEEIQSHASGASGSPSPSPPNGRITVTVAAAPPLAVPKSSAHNALTLALPIQTSNKNNGGGGGGGGGGGREDCWSEGATAVLIDAWGERYLELSRGNLKQNHWKEVADIVSSREDYTKTPKTDIQCKNRIDTVKKKYKSEKAKMAAGSGPSKWQFFERLDHLIGPTAKIPAATAGPSSISMSSKVPVAIPVGVRGGGNQFLIQKHQPQRSKNLKNQKLQFRRRGQMDSEEEESEEEEVSPDSDDSFPPEKKPRVMRREVGEAKEKKGGWGNSLRLLTQAILKFGEAYEAAETAKLQQVVEMEKQRMKFAKDLELQRMQFFMKTQLEISQMKHGRKGVNSSNHHCNNNNNNSDSN